MCDLESCNATNAIELLDRIVSDLRGSSTPPRRPYRANCCTLTVIVCQIEVLKAAGLDTSPSSFVFEYQSGVRILIYLSIYLS